MMMMMTSMMIALTNSFIIFCELLACAGGVDHLKCTVEWALITVAELADNTENCVRFGNAGACKCISNVLRTFGDSVTVAEAGCIAIANLAVLDDNRTWLGTSNACEVVVTKGLNNHDKVVSVSESACRAIYTLSLSHPGNRLKLGIAGACKAIPRIILKHPGKLININIYKVMYIDSHICISGISCITNPLCL